MKLTPVTIISSLLLSLSLGGRGVNAQYNFLVSGIRPTESWCITATNGVGDDVNLGFRRCEFNGMPNNQLWRLNGDGTIESAVQSGRCMVVGFGTELFPGVRIRMSSCNSASQYFQFDHNGGTDQLRLRLDGNYCVSNRGTNPNDSDTILALACKNEGRFYFTYTPGLINPTTPPIQPPVFYEYASFNGGCLTVASSNAVNDQQLRLESCSRSFNGWNMDGNGLLHSELDYGKCMQAGRTAAPVHGSPMRVYDCDAGNPLQRFQMLSDGQLQLEAYNYLCVDHRGVNANINVDPIIAKDCSIAGGWSTSGSAPVPPQPTRNTGNYREFSTGGGCLTVGGSNSSNGQKLMLESCSRYGNGWRVDGNGLFHSELDDSKCMHAGYTGAPGHGVPLRIRNCSSGNTLQRFEVSGGKIRLQNTNLCVDHRGDSADVNQDPIILKRCSRAGVWS